jgi:hypothetical protein
MQRSEIPRDSEVQASALLALGSVAWKIVSFWSNVSFLVSIRQAGFSAMIQFLQSTGWWVIAVIGVGWFVLRVSNKKAEPNSSPTWLMVTSVGVVAFLFGTLLALRSAGGIPNVFAQWGAGPDSCFGVIDTSKLVSFREDYQLALACGVNDPTVDKLDDNRIVVSNLFEILPSGVSVVVPVSSTLADLEKTPAGQGGGVWHEALLIPRGVSKDKISRLRDVLQFRGKIVDEQYWR